MRHVPWLAVLTAGCLIGCDSVESQDTLPGGAVAMAAASQGPACEILRVPTPLPGDVRETSGLARSARDPGLFWTHNDAGSQPDLFAIGAGGQLVQRVRVTGADLVDWEDMEAAACEGERGGSCLYVGDIGDNDGERRWITVYRVQEPEAGASRTAPVEALHARFPDGPRDAEALFVDGSGTVYVVSKGRRGDVALYSYPAPYHPDRTVTLERGRVLFPQPERRQDLVTAATSTPDGRWVGIRTYRALYLYSMESLAGDQLAGDQPLDPTVIDLSALGEPQGEALVLSDDGTVWVSTEGDGDSDPPRWSQLRCRFPDG